MVLSLVEIDVNRTLCNTQQGYSPSGEGELSVDGRRKEVDFVAIGQSEVNCGKSCPVKVCQTNESPKT
jgi:hypothetical protein